MSGIIGGKTLLDIDRILDRSGVEEGMSVADLGCGSSGYVVFNCAKKIGKSGLIYAVDVVKTSLENIERAIKQQNLENVKTVWSNMEIFGATKVEANKLDMAFLVNMLFQSEKRAQIIREAVRMLKKDGKLIIVDWKNTSLPFGPEAEKRVRVEPLKAAAGKLGLKLEDEFEAGPYHYGLIFTKL